jgi:diadenosine tetraphosphatase ApaH/serine/threonine PP2A family protein phosphatase
VSNYAIVSDIHSNLEALDAVLARIEPEQKLLALGDIVGYGPNPNECVDRIRSRAAACVMGNHDLAAIENYGLQYFNPFARAAIEWTQRVLSPQSAAWLSDLDYEYRTEEFLLVHGAPIRFFSYILDSAGARRAFEATDAPIVFVGHSHVAEYYALRDGRIEHQHMQNGGSLQLEDGVRYVINVGSVGQPRDLNPEAAFATYDSTARVVRWIRVPYAVQAVQGKIEDAGLPPYLGERLAVGR